MPLEYEYRYALYNKKDIINNIIENKGVKQGTYLFRVTVFKHPLSKPHTYIRVRDEGFKITMTYKEKTKDKFEEEQEIIIDNYETGINIMYALGCSKLYSYEKIREIWNIKDAEIVFDTNPGRVDIMEVESNTEKKLLNAIKKLKLQNTSHDDFVDADLYMNHFGIDLKNKIEDLSFTNIKQLQKLVKKNMKEFKKLIDNQVKQYKKVKK